MEFIKLHGQRVVGLRNDGQVVSVRGLESDNRVTAIENTSKNGLITLLDSRLTGTRGAATLPAVINSGAMFVRDVNTTGYAVGVKNIAEQGTRQDAPSGDVREWVSHAPYAAQSGSRKSSLRLPVKETPIAPQDALDQWVSPAEFGGSPDDDLDDTEAVQKAIDSGRTTLYFPVSTNKKMWRIDGTVLVRGAIHRITSLECRLAGTGVFRVVDGAAPQVVLDRIDLYQGGLSLEQASSRPVTFSGMIFGSGKIIDNGAGDLFIEDVCVGQFVINKSNVWMRQYNPESKERKILNDGGTLWVLGLKTEQAGTICETVDGGRTEILGGFIYSQGAEKTTPMFVVKDAQMTATVGETTWNKRNFRTILEETADSNSNCNGESNKVGGGGLTRRSRGGGWGEELRFTDFFGRRCAFVVTNAQREGSIWRVRARSLTCESSRGSSEANVARNVACYIGFWSVMAVSRWPAGVEVTRDDVANVAHSIRPWRIDRKRRKTRKGESARAISRPGFLLLSGAGTREELRDQSLRANPVRSIWLASATSMWLVSYFTLCFRAQSMQLVMPGSASSLAGEMGLSHQTHSFSAGIFFLCITASILISIGS